MDNIYTGYFGLDPIFCPAVSRPFPNVPSRWTKVHIVKENKPICNSNIGNNMGFRNMISGICLKWVECKKCQKLASNFGDYLIDENGVKLKNKKSIKIMSPIDEAILLSCVMENLKQERTEKSGRWKSLESIYEELTRQIENINRVKESILLRIENERKINEKIY